MTKSLSPSKKTRYSTPPSISHNLEALSSQLERSRAVTYAQLVETSPSAIISTAGPTAPLKKSTPNCLPLSSHNSKVSPSLGSQNAAKKDKNIQVNANTEAYNSLGKERETEKNRDEVNIGAISNNAPIKKVFISKEKNESEVLDKAKEPCANNAEKKSKDYVKWRVV